MTTTLLRPPEGASGILRRLRENGFEALLCGGCVRDALMGKAPKDYDIATAATPETVERLFPKTVPIGKAFGVILVEGEDGLHYEVATFRSEKGYADGRRPDAVEFSSAREDAARRDFTINALFFDPFENSLIDYAGGAADIAAGVLRTVGDAEERFREDHLRLLRAVRFAARTGFAVEPATRAAMERLADLVATVSPERVAAETEAMLTGGHSREAFRLYRDTGLLRRVLPEVDAMAGVEQPPDFHPEGDVWTHTLVLLGLHDQATTGAIEPPPCLAGTAADLDARRGMERGDFSAEEYRAGVLDARAAVARDGVGGEDGTATLAWAALLHDIGKPGTIQYSDRIRFNNHDILGAEMSTAILERLRRPRRLVDGVFDLIRRHIHFSTLRKMRKSKLRRWLRGGEFPLHLELHRMDCASSHSMLANWWFGLRSWREERALPPEPEALLRGGDVLAQGVAPGPQVGRLLAAVEDARLEGIVTDRESALEYLRDAIIAFS
jgi:poly(A) polymerase